MKQVVLVDMRFFGNCLKEVRHSLHLSQRDVAKLLHMDPHEYVRYEQGRTCISEAIFKRLAHHAVVSLHARRELTLYYKK